MNISEGSPLLSDEVLKMLKELFIEEEKKASKEMHSLYEELLACSTDFFKAALPLLLKMANTTTLAEPWSTPRSDPSADLHITKEGYSRTQPPQDQKN